MDIDPNQFLSSTEITFIEKQFLTQIDPKIVEKLSDLDPFEKQLILTLCRNQDSSATLLSILTHQGDSEPATLSAAERSLIEAMFDMQFRQTVDDEGYRTIKPLASYCMSSENVICLTSNLRPVAIDQEELEENE